MLYLDIDAATRACLAPGGRLRASINLGNPILANANPDTGEVTGVSVDLARRLAGLLNVEVDLLVFDAAAKAVEAVTNEVADIGFFAVDPVRGAGISFTAPYVLIEGSYLVHAGSPLRFNEEVDRKGHRIAVGKGSAYDLFLTRQLLNAEIIRAATSPAVVDTFLEQGLDVAAGVRQQLEHDMERRPGVRLLPGHFMVIQQAMGLSKRRSAEAATALSMFVELAKSDGFVAQALERHHIEGASIAPLL